jgi:hypothetical protein
VRARGRNTGPGGGVGPGRPGGRPLSRFICPKAYGLKRLHEDPDRLTAREHAGVNSNLLADESQIDPVSGNAVLNGIPVELAPVTAPVPA